MDRKIEEIGKYFELDSEGFVVNGASLANVQPIWRPVISDIVAKYNEQFKESLHSIYLRGSVASGDAVPYFSDIDTFALIKVSDGYIRWREVSWGASFQHEMREKYDFVRHIDVSISSFVDDIFAVNPKLAMVLKTQSCVLFGSSVIDTIKKFRPGPEMILNLPWLREDLNAFLIVDVGDYNFKEKCSEILKILIRCGFELVMERTQKYTNSLYLCYREFSYIYSQKEGEEMKLLLHYFLNPELCGEESKNLILKMGEFILRQASKKE